MKKSFPFIAIFVQIIEIVLKYEIVLKNVSKNRLQNSLLCKKKGHKNNI